MTIITVPLKPLWLYICVGMRSSVCTGTGMSVKMSDSFFVAVSMSSYEVDVNSYIRGPGKVLVITRSHQLVYTHINTATVFSGTLKPFQNKSMKAVTQMRKKYREGKGSPHFLFLHILFLWAHGLESLDWIFKAGCVQHLDESNGLQLVYSDLIRCCSSLQTPHKLLIGYLSRKHAI